MTSPPRARRGASRLIAARLARAGMREKLRRARRRHGEVVPYKIRLTIPSAEPWLQIPLASPKGALANKGYDGHRLGRPADPRHPADHQAALEPETARTSRLSPLEGSLPHRAHAQSRRLKEAKREERNAGPPPQPRLSAMRQAIPVAFAQPRHREVRTAASSLVAQNLPKIG